MRAAWRELWLHAFGCERSGPTEARPAWTPRAGLRSPPRHAPEAVFVPHSRQPQAGI